MIVYREDLDLTSMVDDIAKRIQVEVDQQALDKAAATLAKFGYEKVVRCRDCRYYQHNSFHRCDLHAIAHEVEPDGYCAWGERREE